MGSSFLLFETYFGFPLLQEPPKFPSSMGLVDPAGNRENQTTTDLVLYSVITTVICGIGVFTNALSLMVLRRKELNWSVYTYLTVLAAADLALSIMFLLGGLARGTFCSTDLFVYDTFIGLPIVGTINSMGVLATVGVTIDRVFYLWNPSSCSRPKFCDRKVARKIMIVGLVVCVVINSPYCFIFERNGRGDLVVSKFFRSSNYIYFNWFMLLLLTIIPGIILITGNFFLLTTLQKAKRARSKCCSEKKLKDHTTMTVTLVCVIMLFVVTEIPSNLLSRTRAVTLIFIGGYVDVDSEILEVTRAVCTVLGALNATVNFLLYYLLCPPFCRALRDTFAKMGERKNLQVNVIVLSEHPKKILQTLFQKEHASNGAGAVSEYVVIGNKN